MNKTDRIYIAGHRGMVGSALKRALESAGYTNLIMHSSSNLDLRNQAAVTLFFKEQRPDYVFLAAAKVGGIWANNTYRADFLYDNLMIASNVIHAAFEWGVKKLLFLGSSCIYPKLAQQPIQESALLTGTLESTNEPYAIAKIAGIKLCEAYHDQHSADFISVMPTNLYGIGDNYHPQHSHVLPSLVRRFHEAKERNNPEVVVWGTGTPRREFLYADDLADACLFLMQHYSENSIVNVGTGEDISIKDLAYKIKALVGYKGRIVFDSTKPDGTPRKLLDVTRIHRLGWHHTTDLDDGLLLTYHDYLKKKQAFLETT